MKKFIVALVSDEDGMLAEVMVKATSILKISIEAMVKAHQKQHHQPFHIEDEIDSFSVNEIGNDFLDDDEDFLTIS